MKGADFSELDELAADLTRAGARTAVKAIPVMHRAANNIVRDAKQLAPGAGGDNSAAKHYPDSITYDLEVTTDAIVVEVGPDKARRQGALGNLLEYGTSTHAPHAHLGPALDRESPNLDKYLGELGAETLGFR